MALSGSLTYISSTGTGEYENVSIDIPADATEENVFYEYRGQTVTQSVEINNITSQSYEGIYVKTTHAQVWYPRISSDENTCVIETIFRVYGSQASRSADIDNYILEDTTTGDWNQDTDTDPFGKAYDSIKLAFPNDALTDV